MDVPWIQYFKQLAEQESRIIAGLMSGTSADGVDVAICRISGNGLPTESHNRARVEMLYFYEHPLPAALRERILIAAKASLREIAELHVAIGDFFGEALVTAAAKGRGEGLPDIDLVGSHGQTVYHHSGVSGAMRCTLQLGCGDRIATRAGIPVIFDFRPKDIAVGGEGAPLTPYADAILFGDRVGSRAVMLNLGGIANISVLSEDPQMISGFDTGPANSLLDRLVRIITKGEKHYDDAGALAAQGKVNFDLLAKLIADDDYLKRPPPKSSGFEVYGENFIDTVIKLNKGVADKDLLATLVEFVAQTIGISLQRFVPFKVDEVIVVGGGARNDFLLQRIGVAVAPARVTTGDAHGVPAKAREAIAWALFANEFVFGNPVNLPTVTGATRPTILGKLSLP